MTAAAYRLETYLNAHVTEFDQVAEKKEYPETE